jgi:hypothetical protein
MQSDDRRGALADDLRQGAAMLRESIDSVSTAFDTRKVLLRDIPNGRGHVLRVVWRPDPPRGGPHVSIRVWREQSRGKERALTPVGDLGVEVAYFRLPDLAEAIADALELARDNVREFRRHPHL